MGLKTKRESESVGRRKEGRVKRKRKERERDVAWSSANPRNRFRHVAGPPGRALINK